MTRPPSPLEQFAVGLAFAAATRAVLERLDRRRRPLDVERCLVGVPGCTRDHQ